MKSSFFATSDEEGTRLITDRWQKYRNGAPHTISEEVRVYTVSYSESLCTPEWSTMEIVDPPEIPETYTIVAESEFPVNVNMMFKLGFVDSIRDREEMFHELCEDKDFKCSRWRPHDEFGLFRDISFKQYVNISSDPISCSCKEVQKFRASNNSFAVITSQEIRSESNEYCFNVEGLFDVRRNSDESEDSCVLRIYIKLPILGGNFGEGDIESSILDDFRERYGKWVEKGMETINGSVLSGQCFESGIFRYHVFDGQGQDIPIDNEVVLSYSIDDSDAVRFEGFLTNLAEKLNYNQEFVEAVMGLKYGSMTALAIPPSVSNSGMYTMIYIRIIDDDEEVSSDAGSSNFEVPSHGITDAAEVFDSLFAKTILHTSRKIMGSNINYSRIAKTLGAGTLIISSTNVIMGLVRKKKTERYSWISSDIVNKIFKTPNTESIQPRTGNYPDITYRVIHDGQGLSIYQQGCFVYKKSGDVKLISFEGSPTELAIHFIRGYEEAIGGIRPDKEKLLQGFEEAIVGMKLNETRRIIIPPTVTGLEEGTYIDLTLMNIKDTPPRKINFLASKI